MGYFEANLTQTYGAYGRLFHGMQLIVGSVGDSEVCVQTPFLLLTLFIRLFLSAEAVKESRMEGKRQGYL